MSRWNEFRRFDESIPSSNHEAVVFMSNAWSHLSNQGLSDDVLDARIIITQAMFSMSWKEVA